MFAAHLKNLWISAIFANCSGLWTVGIFSLMCLLLLQLGWMWRSSQTRMCSRQLWSLNWPEVRQLSAVFRMMMCGLKFAWITAGVSQRRMRLHAIISDWAVFASWEQLLETQGHLYELTCLWCLLLFPSQILICKIHTLILSHLDHCHFYTYIKPKIQQQSC